MQHPFRVTLNDNEAARFIDELRDFCPEVITPYEDPIFFCRDVIDRLNAGNLSAEEADEVRRCIARSIVCPIEERRSDPLWLAARAQRAARTDRRLARRDRGRRDHDRHATGAQDQRGHRLGDRRGPGAALMGEVIRFSQTGDEAIFIAPARRRSRSAVADPTNESEVVRIVTTSMDRLPRASREGAATTLDVAETAARTARALKHPRVCQLWEALARAARDRLAQFDQGEAVAASQKIPLPKTTPTLPLRRNRPLQNRVQDARDALRPPAQGPAVEARARKVRGAGRRSRERLRTPPAAAMLRSSTHR